jgi:hypothetical protein
MILAQNGVDDMTLELIKDAYAQDPYYMDTTHDYATKTESTTTHPGSASRMTSTYGRYYSRRHTIRHIQDTRALPGLLQTCPA